MSVQSGDGALWGQQSISEAPWYYTEFTRRALPTAVIQKAHEFIQYGKVS